MSYDTKTLARGEVRFVVKKNDTSYRVYDREGGSFPYRTVELGTVLQDVTELEAQAEADRLNELFVGAAPAPRKRTIQPDTSAGDQLPSRAGRKKARVARNDGPPPGEEVSLFKEAEWVDESDIGDYGDLSAQTDGYVDWKETS